MTGLLLGLLLSAAAPAAAQERLPDKEADNPQTPTDLPALVALRRTDNAYRRKWLRRAGGSGMGVAAVWWLTLGDSWNAGDASTVIGGVGLVALTGAVLGGSFAGVYTDESPLDWEASTPTLSLTPGVGGTATVGEEAPYTLTLSAAPRVRLSDGTSLVLAAEIFGDLGWSRELDPRPQGAFETALQERTRGLDLAPELRARISPTLQLRFRAQAQVRLDDYLYGDDPDAQGIRRTALAPMAGLAWDVSGRQRFWFLFGPRFDTIAWRAADETSWSSTGVLLGPPVGQAAYEIHLPDPDWIPGAWEFRRRLRVRYTHSRFDGDGYNRGAMIGFFGPVDLRYDIRARKPQMRWALQGALTLTISDHGGLGLTLGVVPPRRERG